MPTGDPVASASRIRPLINEDTTHFWKAVGAGRLAIQRCKACGELRHPPSPMCPHCQSLQWDTLSASGRGRIHSFTVVHHPAVPPFGYPNVIGLIELDEGVRLISQVIAVTPDQVAIGMEVVVSFEEVEEGLVLPLFKPASSEDPA